jgi:hypothetical protein
MVFIPAKIAYVSQLAYLARIVHLMELTLILARANQTCSPAVLCVVISCLKVYPIVNLHSRICVYLSMFLLLLKRELLFWGFCFDKRFADKW